LCVMESAAAAPPFQFIRTLLSLSDLIYRRTTNGLPSVGTIR
jgi:hypothetical protein